MPLSKRSGPVAACMALIALTTQGAGAEVMTEQDVRDGYKKHAALTQLHRWYQFYENGSIPIENQLDILDGNVKITSALGEGTGHEVYKERVAQIPKNWKNSHSVKKTDAEIAEDGTVRLNVDITYLNEGMLEGGAVRSAELSYTTTLAPTDTVLPKFTSIAIAQKGDGTAGSFEDVYVENRLLSLVHYWLALIEDPSRNPDPVREILADGFSLNFSSGAITDFEGFRAWLVGPASQVQASTHGISNFLSGTLAEGRYKMTVDFAWQGILPDGNQMTAKTRHTWIVTDNPADRFAKITSVDVEILEPFAPLKN